jgi:hypothetical protein
LDHPTKANVQAGHDGNSNKYVFENTKKQAIKTKLSKGGNCGARSPTT